MMREPARLSGADANTPSQPGVRVFDEHVNQYDRWFDENAAVYRSELDAVARSIPPGIGLEVGMGTGRFAVPLGIRIGVEPSRAMAEMAHERGIHVVQALGERLPFRAVQFDFVLLVTVICFVGSLQELLLEAHRVLRAGGRLITAFIDRESHLGGQYESHKAEDVFYRVARFYSVEEVIDHVQRAGFGQEELWQTVFDSEQDIPDQPTVREGYGEGAFVVLSAAKV